MIRRPSSRTCLCTATASSSPSGSASSGHTSGAIRSVGRPTTSCSTSRTSSSARRERSRSAWGTSTSQVATRAVSTLASRSPPWASLRSGTETCASSPTSSWRARTSLRRAGSCSVAPRRHDVSMVVRSRRVRLGSPARCRTSSRPSATRTSSAAADTISGTERTEWSRRAPESHRGYQSCWPRSPSATRSSCTRTTSRSDWGASSRRPKPPTATRATPVSGPPAASYAPEHRASAAAVRALRSTALIASER